MTDDLRAFANGLFATTPPPAPAQLSPDADADATMREFTRNLFANNDED